jgi:hypothetical protein
MRSLPALLLLAVAGCASTDHIDEASEWAAALARKDHSIVFGRIRWMEHGKECEIGDGYTSMSITPHLTRMEDEQRITGEVDEGGHFVWSLEPGAYLMHMIVYRDPWSGTNQLVPKVAFAVREKGRVYYVGTLNADFAKERNFLGQVGGNVRLWVTDENAKETVRLRDELGLGPQAVEPALMRRDERLPLNIETTAGFRLAQHILWSIAIYNVGRY